MQNILNLVVKQLNPGAKETDLLKITNYE